MIQAIGPMVGNRTIRVIHRYFGIRAGMLSSGVRAQSSRAYSVRANTRTTDRGMRV